MNKSLFRNTLRCVWLFVPLFGLAGCPAKVPSENIFRYNEPEGIATLDPAQLRNRASFRIAEQLYTPLVSFDSTLGIKPLACKSFEQLDVLHYIFHLRKDISFHNGRKLTAMDFVYSFERICKPETKSTAYWIFRDNVQGASDFFEKKSPLVSGFAVPNDSTFAITLRRPFPPFLKLLATLYCSPVAREEAETENAFRSPVGTGAFKFKSWKDGVALDLVRNDAYFEQGLPKLSGIRVSFIGDRKSEFLEFEKGNFEMCDPLPDAFTNAVLEPDGHIKSDYQKYQFAFGPYLNTEYYGVRLDKVGSPLQQKEIRRAINLAIDRRKLCTYILHGFGTPAEQGVFPDGLATFDRSLVGYSYQPDSARAMLTRLGYSMKNKLPLKLTINPTVLEAAEAVQRMLAEVFIDLKIETVQFGTLLQLVSKGEAELWRTSWIADYPDAENYLALFYSKNFSPAGPNTTHFKNVTVDSLYEAALRETNEVKRIVLYRAAEKIIVAESPWVFLFYDKTKRILQPNVHDLYTNALGGLPLKYVSLNPAKPEQ
jgi:oligopeptide transport system substrate-binding protein